MYLKAIGEEDFENWIDFPTEKLDNLLVKFWFTVHTKKGEFLSLATLQNVKHALNRALKRAEKKLDITKDTAFIKSQEAYKDAARELKSKGKAVVNHYLEIKPTGI